MEGPYSGKDRERQKEYWECPHLQLRFKCESAQLIEIKRSRGDIGGDDPKKDQYATEEGVKRQLHRAVVLVSRTPDGDQEILRDNDQLIKHAKQKQISAEKHEVGTHNNQQQPKKRIVTVTQNIR